MGGGAFNNEIKKTLMGTKLPRKVICENQGNTEIKLPDTAETIYISALALLKMLKHGRAGIPLEVMGLMLGEFIDDYTVHVVDVFAMPQTALGVSVEAIDSVFQTKMLDMLKRTGRDEYWVGTIPIRGSVVGSLASIVKRRPALKLFTHGCINPMTIVSTSEVRSVTSNLGHIRRVPIIVRHFNYHSIVHGLNRTYYSLNIVYRRDLIEQKMLKNLNKQSWMHGILPVNYETHSTKNLKSIDEINTLLKLYETPTGKRVILRIVLTFQRWTKSFKY
ncbi:LOW QUALITY PROTEIN: hypothetical protein MXB_4812 [Myxobolus squamalis]|nr:LOW QUALITY PROTEIN: hypothetical protein MXB_4812 [Myxobolus squamalis]